MRAVLEQKYTVKLLYSKTIKELGNREYPATQNLSFTEFFYLILYFFKKLGKSHGKIKLV